MCDTYIYREANKVADFLASSSLNHDGALVMLDDPPPDVQNLLQEDKAGVSWPREVRIFY